MMKFEIRDKPKGSETWEDLADGRFAACLLARDQRPKTVRHHNLESLRQHREHRVLPVGP